MRERLECAMNARESDRLLYPVQWKASSLPETQHDAASKEVFFLDY